jgi:hypothetical protein
MLNVYELPPYKITCTELANSSLVSTMNPKAKHMEAMLLHILQKKIPEKKTSILVKNLFDPKSRWPAG